MADETKHLPRVVIIGAGFAGIQVAKRLKNAPVQVVLLDRHNYHTFQPLLYQVATAALSPADIAYPVRRIFRTQQNVQVGLVEMSSIDLNNKLVIGPGGQLKYDYLVLACGATHSYFGKPEWSKDAPGLKTIDDALEIRKRILIAFEEAEYEADEQARRAKLTFAIVGGGPTGVELAGALREIASKDIPKDFRSIDTTTARIILLQGGDRLLPAMHPSLGERAKHDLEGMGVEVRLNARVTNVDHGGVWVGTERVECENIVWATGVEAAPITRSLGVPLDRSGRVVVNPDLTAPGHRDAFVVGDAASVIDPISKLSVPGVAPAAMQMGKYVAKIIADDVGGKTTPREPFHYFDKGTMATIGKARAVADIKGWRFGGFIAWLMWGLIHIMFLISFRSRFFVMLAWIGDYVLNNRAVRLITGQTKLEFKKVRLPEFEPVTKAE